MTKLVLGMRPRVDNDRSTGTRPSAEFNPTFQHDAELYRNGLDWISENLASMISDLTTLVKCDTSFPPGNNYPAFVNLIDAISSDLDGSSERIVVPEKYWKTAETDGPRVNLVRIPKFEASDAPPLHIYFHTDTAPAGDGWSKAPFDLTREGDKLYGRGTADMKGAMVAALCALRALSVAKMPLRYRPLLLFCTDEEGGKFPGIRYLAEQGRLDGAILNLNGSATPRIWAGCFGSLDIRLRFIGHSTHSGNPAGGTNALEEAILPVARLLDLKKLVERRQSKMPSPDPRFPLHGMLSITSANAGIKGSALPGLSEFIINRRYLPEEDMTQVMDEIKTTIADAVASTQLLDHELEVIGHLPPVIDPDGPETARWTAAQSAGYAVPLNKFRRFGSTTSSDFGWVQRAGFKHIMLGGLSRPERHVHGPDEHTTTDDIIGLARSIFLFLTRNFDLNFELTTENQEIN